MSLLLSLKSGDTWSSNDGSVIRIQLDQMGAPHWTYVDYGSGLLPEDHVEFNPLWSIDEALANGWVKAHGVYP